MDDLSPDREQGRIRRRNEIEWNGEEKNAVKKLRKGGMSKYLSSFSPAAAPEFFSLEVGRAPAFSTRTLIAPGLVRLSLELQVGKRRFKDNICPSSKPRRLAAGMEATSTDEDPGP